jgi:hypothetical protein
VEGVIVVEEDENVEDEGDEEFILLATSSLTPCLTAVLIVVVSRGEDTSEISPDGLTCSTVGTPSTDFLADI